MGLLICLSGAPWTGIEIDEVHRVGRALEDHVGDDHAWFEEWTRMGDKIEARGRDEERKGHKRTAASCFMRASRYYQTGERFIHPRSQRSMDVYAKSVKIFQDAAAILRDRRIEPVEVPYGTTSLPALLVHPDPAATGGKPAPCMVFFDGFDVTKELQYGYGVPDLAARGIGCLIVDGPGNGESVRFRNLPLIAETEHYATPVYEYLAARREFDAETHRRDGAVARRLLRAARRIAGAALCVLRRLGRAVGLSRDLGEAARRPGVRQGAVAFGAAGASAMGAGCRQPGGGAQEARRLPPRRHRAADEMSVPAAARGGRRTNPAGAGGEMFRGSRLEAEDVEGVPARGRRHENPPATIGVRGAASRTAGSSTRSAHARETS